MFLGQSGALLLDIRLQTGRTQPATNCLCCDVWEVLATKVGGILGKTPAEEQGGMMFIALGSLGLPPTVADGLLDIAGGAAESFAVAIDRRNAHLELLSEVCGRELVCAAKGAAGALGGRAGGVFLVGRSGRHIKVCWGDIRLQFKV
jgi:hypothetical protein